TAPRHRRPASPSSHAQASLPSGRSIDDLSEGSSLNARHILWCASFLLLAGCAHPTIPGPQLTCLPEGFGFDGHFQTTQRFLPGRHVVEQRGYVVTGQDPTANYILIMTLSGATSYESLLQNWNTAVDRTGSAEWGPLQPLPM